MVWGTHDRPERVRIGELALGAKEGGFLEFQKSGEGYQK